MGSYFSEKEFILIILVVISSIIIRGVMENISIPFEYIPNFISLDHLFNSILNGLYEPGTEYSGPKLSINSFFLAINGSDNFGSLLNQSSKGIYCLVSVIIHILNR